MIEPLAGVSSTSSEKSPHRPLSLTTDSLLLTNKPFLAYIVVEDQPAGYPQFAALLGLHPSFYVFRRFSTLRARILLYKQDKLTQLESKLEDVDREEPRVLFHGSARRDKNEARHSLLADIEAALETYGL